MKYISYFMNILPKKLGKDLKEYGNCEFSTLVPGRPLNKGSHKFYTRHWQCDYVPSTPQLLQL